jgi:hypothetical protein
VAASLARGVQHLAMRLAKSAQHLAVECVFGPHLGGVGRSHLAAESVSKARSSGVA